MGTLSKSLSPDQLEALLNGPAETPPTGVVPNFQNPRNLNDLFILTATLTWGSATLAVLFRIYTKSFIIRSINYEDYAIILGWLLFVASAVPCVLTLEHGGGVHMWDLHFKDTFSLLYWINFSSIIYCPLVFFVKLSILLQYLRIFVPNRKANMPLFVAIQVCIWSCFILYFVSMIFAIVDCTPREKIWNPLITGGHCFNASAAYLATSIINVLTDFTILILPMPSLWKLQMPIRRKILTSAIFATGGFACIISIIRTTYAVKLLKVRDASYMFMKMDFWTIAEVAIGIIVSCAPVLPKFFSHFLPRIYGKFSTLRSKASRSSDHEPTKHSITIEKPEASLGFKKYFPKGQSETHISDAGSESHRPLAKVSREYGTREDYEKPGGGQQFGESHPQCPKPTATRRDDLESGLDDFWIGGQTETRQ